MGPSRSKSVAPTGSRRKLAPSAPVKPLSERNDFAVHLSPPGGRRSQRSENDGADDKAIRRPSSPLPPPLSSRAVTNELPTHYVPTHMANVRGNNILGVGLSDPFTIDWTAAGNTVWSTPRERASLLGKFRGVFNLPTCSASGILSTWLSSPGKTREWSGRYCS